jgi:hypothetical protein
LTGRLNQQSAPEAAINLNERNAIEDPLARILERLSPEMTAKVQVLADPILLAFGLGLWGLRLYKISTEKEKKQPAKEKDKQPAPVTKEKDTENPRPENSRDAPVKGPEVIGLTQPV